jgi:dTDP-4-dehydrorhamnose reductase
LYNSSKEVLNRIELLSGKRPIFYELDITDQAALDKVFQEHPDIDNVIHFAALKVSKSAWLYLNLAKKIDRPSESQLKSHWSTTESTSMAVFRF